MKTMMLISILIFNTALAVAAPPVPILYEVRNEKAREAVAYLDLAHVRRTHDLTPWEALEVQGWMNESIQRNPSLTHQDAYIDAVAKVRMGLSSTGWKTIQFNHSADFVVALDLDETLLDQWYNAGRFGFFDLRGIAPDLMDFPHDDPIFSSSYIKFAPGAEELLLRLKKNPHCKGLILFSAKRHAAVQSLLSKWKLRDGTLAKDLFSGVFTRNHLLVTRLGGYPIKDLRFLDPALSHVAIVDDNPNRILAKGLLLIPPRFDADHLDMAQFLGDPSVETRARDILKTIGDSIEIASERAKTSGRSFASELSPFSRQSMDEHCARMVLPEEDEEDAE